MRNFLGIVAVSIVLSALFWFTTFSSFVERAEDRAVRASRFEVESRIVKEDKNTYCTATIKNLRQEKTKPTAIRVDLHGRDSGRTRESAKIEGESVQFILTMEQEVKRSVCRLSVTREMETVLVVTTVQSIDNNVLNREEPRDQQETMP